MLNGFFDQSCEIINPTTEVLNLPLKMKLVFVGDFKQ